MLPSTLFSRARRSVILMLAATVTGLMSATAALPQVGLQTWTCRNLSFDQMVAFAVEHDLKRIQLYRSHVDPRDAVEVNAAKLAVLREHGIEPYAMYAGMGRDLNEDRRYFALARQYGMAFLVVEPADQSKWPELLALAREHGLRLAVHNHGLETTYGDPATVRALLERYDELAVCLDVGWVTAAGFDAAEVFRRYGDRVIDLHFKDKRVVTTEGRRVAEDTLPGEGHVNFPGLFKAIRETGWSGTMAIETDSAVFAEDPRELVQFSKAFFRARLTGAGMPLSFDHTRSFEALPEQLPVGLGEAEAGEIIAGLMALDEALRALRGALPAGVEHAHVADAEVLAKNVRWALRYEAELRPADVTLMQAALAEGQRRVAALRSGERPWVRKTGRVVRGHRSEIDGSAQLYGVVVPAGYDGRRPVRLDVVLHGAIQQTGAAMLRFANWFERTSPGWTEPDRDYLEVYPLGRVTNGYRGPGETDVFEVIEAVCRDYAVDRNRIVLRGFSMGASGTWHLGLRHPDRFVALGPYTGYVDTRFFSAGPGANLIRLGELPAHEERVLPTIDAVSYTANAGMVPVIAAIGGADVGFRNHEFMAEAFAREGLQLVNLVARGTGHVVAPVTHRKQLELLGFHAAGGLNRSPRYLRFVTYSLRYPRSHWVELQGLGRHDDRAEIVATVADDGSLHVTTLENITRFTVRVARLPQRPTRLTVLGAEVVPAYRAEADASEEWILEDSPDGWLVTTGVMAGGHKQPGLQGPIDDAFTQPFLCVRGTGEPWHAATAAWADAELQRFAYTWNRYWVGELPVKDDRDVTAEDMRTKNLILFGDPGSNRLMAQVLPKLPLTWNRTELRMRGETYASGEHVPVMIHPNPLSGAEGRYVVLNSGHTFGEPALSTVAYLIYPRRGDWAVVRTDRGSAAQPVQAGHFNEGWTF